MLQVPYSLDFPLGFRVFHGRGRRVGARQSARLPRTIRHQEARPSSSPRRRSRRWIYSGARKTAYEPTPTKSLALADEHAARFPAGVLAQEREVIAIEALVRLGRMKEARARAQRLFRAAPAPRIGPGSRPCWNSVHGDRIAIINRTPSGHSSCIAGRWCAALSSGWSALDAPANCHGSLEWRRTRRPGVL